MSTEIIVKINSEINPDRVATMIAEKCRQEKVDFDITVNSQRRYITNEQKKAYGKLVEIGENIAVKIATPDAKSFNTNRTIIEIDPKYSFGNGLHETTKLCMEAVERHTTKDCTVLDIGCGTGILSVAALVLGAKSAVGIDLDLSSISTTLDNAERNDVKNKYTAIHGNLADDIEGKFDLIVANILTDQLKELLQDIKTHMNHDSVLILSGILDFRCDELIYTSREDFDVINKTEENNWVCLELKLKTDHV
jgi:ribosomal protein L11 methyltransferase